MQIMKQSTGKKTEPLMWLAVALLLAAIASLARQYGWDELREQAMTLGGLVVSGIFAAAGAHVSARQREKAKRAAGG